MLLLSTSCDDAGDQPVDSAAALSDAAVEAAGTTASKLAANASDAARQSVAATTGQPSNTAAQRPDPENTSFDKAIPVAFGETITQETTHGGQVSYFSFPAHAGDYYVLRTDIGSFTPDDVLSVYDDERALIAENGDGSIWPGDKVDTRVIIRPKSSGTYYATLEWRGVPDEYRGQKLPTPLLSRLTISEIGVGTQGYAFEQTDGSDSVASFAQDPTGQYSYVTLIGELAQSESADQEDQDAGAAPDQVVPRVFVLTGRADHALIGQIQAPGVHGNGSTAEAVQLSVVARQARHPVAAIEQARGQLGFHPPLTDGDYEVQIANAGPVGNNGFYAIDLVLMADNPPERTEAANNDRNSAEPISFPAQGRRRGRLLSELPEGDIDFYRFEANRGDSMAVVCEGESGGSGVRGLRAELLDLGGGSLAKSTESSSQSLWIEDVVAETTGTYYLRLSADAPATAAERADVIDVIDVIDPWVRCAVLVD